MIERDHVDAAFCDAVESLRAARGVKNAKPVSRQAAMNEAGQRLVIVDIQQCGVFETHIVAAGTWMTEKNSPSWRMAVAKLS